MPTAAANGIEIYYERAGRGPRLLFFNGSTSTIDASRLMIEQFGVGFDMLVHDQRGLGRTSIPPGPYEMADYARDAAVLLDEIGWDRCRVLGVSFGGMVAQEFATTYPDRVERLALACTSPGGAMASYPLQTLEAMTDAERSAKLLTLLDTRFTPEYLAEHAEARGLVEMMASRASGTKSAETLRGEREQLLARSRFDVCDRLGEITAPTLVAAGRYDGIAPLANSEAIATAIPDAKLRVFNGGHAFFAQDPAALPAMIANLRDA